MAFHIRGAHLCLLLALVATPVRAQDPGVPAELTDWRGRADYAIPDAPAFELLSVDHSTILRPQTTREVALGFSEFVSESGGFAIPRAIAVEFSPALLVDGAEMTAPEYDRMRWLYSTRLSLAALRDSVTGVGTSFAVGIRVSLVDERSLKTDEWYASEQQVTPLTRQILDIYSAANERSIRERPAGMSPEDVVTELTESDIDAIASLKEEIHRRMAARYWNADICDVAVALRATSADSTGRDPRVDALSLWGTYAKGLGVWGQALFGLRLTTERDPVTDEYRQQSAYALRFYLGSKRARGYAESGQVWREEQRAAWSTSAGFEVAAADWVWVEFAAGVEKQGREDPLATTSFRLKAALPGL